MSDINVKNQTQKIYIDPTTRSIAVTNAGPVGPTGSLPTYVKVGTGSPEGSVIAPVGTLYLNQTGGAGTTLYVKESGTGSTGWQPK